MKVPGFCVLFTVASNSIRSLPTFREGPYKAGQSGRLRGQTPAALPSPHPGPAWALPSP